ncbi:hypothetical protein MalM25_33930 [Planctomycetes bacterium MalM25]|nr:hypothetical protein MalM25_33930 [Planctomycetes bacterium MalM25]
MLALFLGLLGAQWFYLKNTNRALLYLIGGTLGWVLVVPALLVAVFSIIEAITWLGYSDRRFEAIFQDSYGKY